MPPNTVVFNVFSYAPLRGSRAQRGLMRPSVRPSLSNLAVSLGTSSKFWKSVAPLTQIVRERSKNTQDFQHSNIKHSKTHCNFNDFDPDSQRMAVSPETSSQNRAPTYHLVSQTQPRSLLGASWNLLGPPGTSWGLLRPPGASCGLLEPLVATRSLLGSPGAS